MFAYCLNNPVNYADATGENAVAAFDWWYWAYCGLGVVQEILDVASSAIPYFLVTPASEKTFVSNEALAESKEKDTKRNNSVYYLRDSSGTVQYVGRTTNVEKRRTAHRANPARAGLEMVVVASGLTYPEARALEQAGMLYHHTINTANRMNNQINGVAPKYWDAYKELALGISNYKLNQMTNEILYWAGC